MSRNGHQAPVSTHRVEVAVRHGSPDPLGTEAAGRIAGLGVHGVREVRVWTVYEIAGKLSSTQVHVAAKDLLCDPVTQEYRVDSAASSSAFLLGSHWSVEVWLKPSVTDPVGESVVKAVSDLGLPAPDSVRTGVSYRILGKLTQAQAEKVASRLFANPLIHRTVISEAR